MPCRTLTDELFSFSFYDFYISVLMVLAPGRGLMCGFCLGTCGRSWSCLDLGQHGVYGISV